MATSAVPRARSGSSTRSPTEIEVGHEARAAGESKYSLYSLIRLNFDLITGFSLAPLQIFTMFAMLCSAGSFLLVLAFVSEDHSMSKYDLANYVASNVEDPVSRIDGCSTLRPSRKLAVIGVSMIEPSGLAIRPRMPASWRICAAEPRAPESAIM
mgnify:CR=1 FL=1